jgi:hypothetical protein
MTPIIRYSCVERFRHKVGRYSILLFAATDKSLLPDFDIDPRGKFEFHESIHDFWRRLDYVD